LRQRSVIALALSLASAVGCGALLAASPASAPEPIAARVPDGPAPWTGLAPLREPDEFRFVVVTDRTGAHRDGVFESAMPRINLVRPEFVVSVGDLIEGYSEDPSVLAAQWDEIEAAVGRLQMPFFYAPGNHDMSNEVMAEAWRARFGPSYYHFVYRDVLFVVLNSELFGMVHDPSQSLPGPWTQAEQLAMLERVLGENAQARWTFVFIHQPLWDAAKVNPDWLRVEQMLGRRPYTVFAGHKHRYTSHVRNDRRFVTLATTGGGSPLRGTAWGEFDHVAQVTMTSQGPVIANLLLDGIVDVDVMTAARRRIVNKLARAVTTEPLLGGGERFRSGTARFTIANPGRHPLEVRGVPEQGRHLDPVEGAIELMVAPRTSASVEIPVRARSAHRYEELAPTSVRWTLSTLDASGERVELATDSLILPEKRFATRRTHSKLSVDGDLRDWGELAFEVDDPAEVLGHGSHRGPADASFRFDLRWDDEALYAAIDVRDDSVVAGAERSAREQDHVSLLVDARPDPDRSANAELFAAIRSGEMAKLVHVIATLEEPRGDPILDLFVGEVPEGIRSASRRTPQGYAVEVRIPRALLDERRGGDWDLLRVNVTVTDFDTGEPDHVSLAWRPSRFGDRAAPGSGTFSRRQGSQKR
jgi:hypothetical protein